MPDGYVIWGAPGTGTTRLAIAITEELRRRGETSYALHTDLLRITLRHCGIEGLESQALLDDPLRAPAAARLPLEVHWAKARTDRYSLVVEGMLALGFAPRGARVLVLEDPGIALQSMEKRVYADLVHKLAPLSSRFLDCTMSLDELVLASLSG